MGLILMDMRKVVSQNSCRLSAGMKRSVPLFILVISILYLNSCGITKRKYLKGFYVHHRVRFFDHKQKSVNEIEKTKIDEVEFVEKRKKEIETENDNFAQQLKTIIREKIEEKFEPIKPITKPKLVVSIKLNVEWKSHFLDFVTVISHHSFSKTAKVARYVPAKSFSKKKIKEYFADVLFFIGFISIFVLIYFFEKFTGDIPFSRGFVRKKEIENGCIEIKF